VFCGADERRAAEARSSAAKYLAPFRKHQVHVGTFRDAYLPFIAAEVKDFFESLKAGESPDLILTHYREDRHQDHRLLSDLAYNTWRDHLILEYEILKYDGDLGRPNLYVTLSEDQCRRKIDFLVGEFGTQRNRQWFTEDTFWGLLRVRGVEAASPTRFAEAFYSRKMVV
jgi:LmbE family N-acetylglucosaminyl deacetylase